jgi:hypothetical protein
MLKMIKKKLIYVLPLFILLYSACDTFNGAGETRSGVYLTIDSIVLNEGAGSLASVNEDTGSITAESDTVDVTISNRPKNAGLIESDWLDIVVTEYQVTFYRTDGGTTVPNSLRRKINFTVDFDDDLNINSLTFLSAEQKLESPLWDLAVNGYDKETEMPVIDVSVMIEIFGHLVSGETIYAKGWTSLAYGVTVQ